MKVLRDACRTVRSTLADDAAWAARPQAARRLDRWKDPDGMGRGDWKLAPADAARMNAAIDAAIERRYRSHRGLRASRATLAADALVNLVTQGPQKPPEVKVTVDHIVPVERGGLTTEENCWRLCRLCRHCHRLKTYGRGRVDTDGPGNRRLVPA